MKYHIYPPIGIARLGNSPTNFFIGSERPGHPGVELENGVENDVRTYKDSNRRIKRQAARFRLFEDAEDGSPVRPAQLPAGASVEWTVHVANRKNAVTRSGGPPRTPAVPTPNNNPQPSTIDPGARTVRGINSSQEFFDNGAFRGITVPLGEIFTDATGNLIFLGASGFSSSAGPATITNFYTNPNWHDDTCDGTVRARVVSNGAAIEASPSWVIAGPPDFAPAIRGVVTLFDILKQAAVSGFGLPVPTQPSFTRDIFPILQRARQLRWVNSDPTWASISDDWPRLASTQAADLPLRHENSLQVRNIQNVLSNHSLTQIQVDALDQWESGNFLSDWQGIPAPSNDITPDGLTQAALDGTVGQGFFPGIEGGIILSGDSFYSEPFRLNHQMLSPGDITARMAVPWQADFWDCARNWWPSQRPDEVRLSRDNNAVDQWDRGISGYLSMVRDFGKLGFIVQDTDPSGTPIFAEAERDPNF